MEAPGIDYEAVLADLEARRASIDAAIEAVKQFVGQPGGPGQSTTPPLRRTSDALPTEIRGDTFFRMGIGDAARKYLAMAKAPKSLKEIEAALVQGGIAHGSTNFTASVHTALTRREKQGELVKVKRGQWGLAEWYPGLKRGRKAENGEDGD